MKMNRIRWILSNINVVNIVLAAVLIVFAYNMLLPLIGRSAKLMLPTPKKQVAAAPAAKADKPADSKSPSPSDFFLIAEQNVFHPERKIPVEKKDAAASKPKPEFVLYGTLLTDDLQMAYMEDKKAPQSAPTRGKKQIPVRLGEPLSGFTLKEVGTDQVVMQRGDEKIVVALNETKTREISAPPPAAPARAAATQPAHARSEQAVSHPQTLPLAASGQRIPPRQPSQVTPSNQQSPSSGTSGSPSSGTSGSPFSGTSGGAAAPRRGWGASRTYR
ncbi:conserved hypothetical protein [Candidatus Sulfobium mesophilum]|uniref:Type II secretion system protein GspC N-terminal domain-containing protein n=1 Tax=Candidatus Sulfobium mesophilum TaxID=2016548 RepID=A0A2U3QFE6_9BACT|nr:conserved hypothetical protein [Candidatus Sulfobium mesophilum]